MADGEMRTADRALRNVNLELRIEDNPFEKQEGDCARCGGAGRIFWCHACGKKFCWECFLKHED